MGQTMMICSSSSQATDVWGILQTTTDGDFDANLWYTYDTTISQSSRAVDTSKSKVVIGSVSIVTTTASPSPITPVQTTGTKPTPIGAIVGGAVGGVAVVAALIGGILFFLYKKKKAARQNNPDYNQNNAPFPNNGGAPAPQDGAFSPAPAYSQRASQVPNLGQVQYYGYEQKTVDPKVMEVPTPVASPAPMYDHNTAPVLMPNTQPIPIQRGGNPIYEAA